MRIYVKPIDGNEPLHLRNALMRYFRDPDLFIGFLFHDEKYRNEKENRVQVRIGGTMEHLLWCIIEKAKFHLTGVSTSTVCNALIARYLYLCKKEIR